MSKNKFFLLAALFMLSGTATFADEAASYPINFEKSQTYTHANRKLNGITLKSALGNQSADISRSQTVYNAVSDQAFCARAGEEVSAGFNYAGNWMNGFVYLDQGRDGSFDATLNADGTFDSSSDIMAFSYAEPTLDSGTGYNSKGEQVSNSNVLQPPTFIIPENLPCGFYMMRYKVDWAGIDPGGRMTATNSIISNGGAICDIRLNVHDELSKVDIAIYQNSTLKADEVSSTEVPFGQALTLDLAPEEGFVLEALRVKHGYNLDGEQFIGGIQQWSEEIIPGFVFADGDITLPAQYIDGNVRLDIYFIDEAANIKYENYTWPEGDKIFSEAELAAAGCIVKRIAATATKGGNSEISIADDLLAHSHRDLANVKEISAVPGDEISLSIFNNNDASISNQNADKSVSLYLDLNQDGHFGMGIFDRNGNPLPTSEMVLGLGQEGIYTFGIHKLQPYGKYRARLVVQDKTSNGEASTATATDFMINVHPEQLKFSVFTTNGSVHGNDVDGLPSTLSYGTAQILRPLAVMTRGYEAENMRIRHGHNLDGEQYVAGNKQWSEYAVAAKTHTIPADSVDGEVRVYVDYVHTTSLYKLVFSDEFNAADGSQPDTAVWSRCQRYGSTWNRWLSINEEEHAATGYIEDGKFVALAVPNPFKDTDNVDMITGGIKTMGNFGFTYGKVECRVKSNPWVGNFPAIWMMPEDQSAGWPDCGEIDIWEVIDASHTSYHTIHSNWTYDLGNKNNPQSSFNKAVKQDTWHTYGLLWDATSLKWYVDGVLVGTYNKSSDSSALEQGQWPFDKHFHLILNQSVGNGAWAAWADITHTYRTEFDWIRVYQLEGQTNTAIEDVMDNEATTSKNNEQAKGVYDLSGRLLVKDSESSPEAHNLPSGIYLVNGKKVIVK